MHTENAYHESMYAKRLILQSRHDFSTYACFAVIDDWKEGHISRENMLRFMMRNGYAMTEPELSALFRRLADHKITYGHLSEFLKGPDFTLEYVKERKPEIIKPIHDEDEIRRCD